MKGQCYCGQVQYVISGDFKFVAHDHCSICRRISGAPFVTWAGVMEPQLAVTQGAMHLTTFKSTPPAERQFCGTCGSHLFFRSTRFPGEVHVTVATLTDELKTPPHAHAYYADRVPWITVQDDLPKHS